MSVSYLTSVNHFLRWTFRTILCCPFLKSLLRRKNQDCMQHSGNVYYRTSQYHNLISHFTVYLLFTISNFIFDLHMTIEYVKWSVNNLLSWVSIPDLVPILVCKFRVDFSLHVHYFIFIDIEFHLLSYWLLRTVKSYCSFSQFQFWSSWRAI